MIARKKNFLNLLLLSSLIPLTMYAMDEATQTSETKSGEESTNQLDIIQKLAESKAIIDQQKAALEQYSTNFAVLKAENTQYAKQNRQYEIELEKQKETSFTLLTDYERDKKDYEKSKIDIENLVNEKEATRQEMAKLNSKIENKKVKNRNLKKSFNNLEEKIEYLKKEKTYLDNLSNTQLKNLVALQEDLKKNKIEMDKLTDQIEELQNKVQPNNSLESNTIEIDQLKNRVKELEEENKKIDTLKNKIQSLSEEKILDESYTNLMRMQEDTSQENIRNNIENQCFPISYNDLSPIITSQINYEKASKGVRALGACVGGAIGGLSVFGLMAALKCMPQNPYINGGVIAAGVATGAGIGCKLAGMCYQKPRIAPKLKNGASVQICYNEVKQQYAPVFSHE